MWFGASRQLPRHLLVSDSCYHHGCVDLGRLYSTVGLAALELSAVLSAGLFDTLHTGYSYSPLLQFRGSYEAKTKHLWPVLNKLAVLDDLHECALINISFVMQLEWSLDLLCTTHYCRLGFRPGMSSIQRSVAPRAALSLAIAVGKSS